MRHAHMASPLSQGPGFPPPSATRYLNAAQAGCLQHPPLGRAGRSKTGLLKALAVASLSAALAACGGSETSSGPATDPETPTNPEKPDTPSTRHALIIDLDGATYRAVQQGMAAGSLPNLAKLNVQLAYSGGVVGTPSQQANLDMPGWASLLTGTWPIVTVWYLRHQTRSCVKTACFTLPSLARMPRPLHPADWPICSRLTMMPSVCTSWPIVLHKPSPCPVSPPRQ
nr:hypothetical protein [Alcaligenes sp. HPC1271]